MKAFHVLAATGLLALGVTACKREPAVERAATDPASAVEALAAALGDSDALRFTRLSLPDDLYAESEARWIEQRDAMPAPTMQDRADFEQTMQLLTAPGAEERLYAELEPLLDRYDAEYRAQLPFVVAMGSAFVNQMIQAHETMSPEQKRQASEMLGAMAAWISAAPIGDRERAREGIAVVTDSMRRVDIASVEAYRELEYEEMLERVSIVLDGLKRVLALYGLDLDAALASVDAQAVSEAGDNAVVRVGYRLFDADSEFDMQMVRVDGRWYSRELIDSARTRLEDGLGPDEVLDEPEEIQDEEVFEEDELGHGATTD